MDLYVGTLRTGMPSRSVDFEFVNRNGLEMTSGKYKQLEATISGTCHTIKALRL
ncbi:hypothetical protein PISMIDRAFT_686343, partial [Pisolithus microcarpus 441]